MSNLITRNAKTIVAVVATIGVVSAGAAVAGGGFDATNAKKVGGLSVKQLSKSTYGVANGSLDNFDNCTFQPVYTRQAGVPAAGYLTLTSTVNASRDTDDPDEGLLGTRLVVDGAVVSTETWGNLENDGVRDASIVNEGVAKVSKGFHTIQIQAAECGNGMAFVTNRQIVTQFSPNGLINAPTKAAPFAKGTNR